MIIGTEGGAQIEQMIDVLPRTCHVAFALQADTHQFGQLIYRHMKAAAPGCNLRDMRGREARSLDRLTVGH